MGRVGVLQGFLLNKFKVLDDANRVWVYVGSSLNDPISENYPSDTVSNGVGILGNQIP